jgi:hypothetical protein
MAVEPVTAIETPEPQGELRIRPEQALRPGRSDARNLLIVWYVRKSFYTWLFLGFIGAMTTSGTTEVAIDWTDPNKLLRELLSPLAGMILAVVVRFGSNWAALALAYPLARKHDAPLEPRTGFMSGIGRWFDRLHVAKAYRSLRWTHHVRQEALRRFGPSGQRVSKLDPIMDNINISMAVLFVVSMVTFTPS